VNELEKRIAFLEYTILLYFLHPNLYVRLKEDVCDQIRTYGSSLIAPHILKNVMADKSVFSGLPHVTDADLEHLQNALVKKIVHFLTYGNLEG
jgi:hypothetical protein